LEFGWPAKPQAAGEQEINMTRQSDVRGAFRGWIAVSVPIVISACGAMMTYGAIKAKTQENDLTLRDLSAEVARLREGGMRQNTASLSQAEQIVELKAIAIEQTRVNLAIEGRLGRIEGKLDRMFESGR